MQVILFSKEQKRLIINFDIKTRGMRMEGVILKDVEIATAYEVNLRNK